MSEELIVLTASTVGSGNPGSGTLALYLSQLEAAGIDYDVDPIAEFPANGGSLAYKIEGLRRRVTQFLNYDRIIFTDGHDMQFFGSREDVLAKIPSEGVLLGAERNCYPEPELIEAIESRTPWAYVNAGFLCGTPQSFMRWLREIEDHPLYDPVMLDQAWFNRRLASQHPLVKIDDRTELVYCTFGEEGEIADLQWEGGLPVNTLCDTYPNFIHCNGRWPSDHIYARRGAYA